MTTQNEMDSDELRCQCPRTKEAESVIVRAGIDWHWSATRMSMFCYTLELESANRERELTLATEALAQREEELAAERRKNAHLVTRLGETREALIDAVALIERIHKTLSP